jgi:hypothetical protein
LLGCGVAVRVMTLWKSLVLVGSVLGRAGLESWLQKDSAGERCGWGCGCVDKTAPVRMKMSSSGMECIVEYSQFSFCGDVFVSRSGDV